MNKSPLITCNLEDVSENLKICVPQKLEISASTLNIDNLSTYDWYRFLKATALFRSLKQVELKFESSTISSKVLDIHLAIFAYCKDLIPYAADFPSQYIYIVGSTKRILTIPKPL